MRPVAAFTKHARRPDGLQPFCNACQRAAVRDHYWRDPEYYRAKARVQDREARALVRAEKSVPCKDCGKRYPPHVMTFDHVRGKKKFDVSLGLRRRLAEILAEIEKCEVVCVNCHAQRTYVRAHGTHLQGV